MKNQKTFAISGFLLALPALLVALSGLLRFDAPPLLIHPLLVVGGLLIGLIINLMPVVRVNGGIAGGSMSARIRIKLRGTLPNMAAIALSLLKLTTIAAYLFV